MPRLNLFHVPQALFTRSVRAGAYLLLPVLMFLLAACSGGDSTPNENTGSNGVDVSTPTPTPVGSGQIPVEDPDGTGRPNSGVITGDARRGVESFRANGCSSCHSGENLDLGPALVGIFEASGDRTNGLSVEEYIRESINAPGAFITPGYTNPSTMPEIDDITDEEIDLIIAYLRTLEPADSQPSNITVASLPDGDPGNGRTLYGARGCSGCHSLGSDRIVGPGFAGVATTAGVRRPGLTADEYLLESIVDSQVFIVAGFPRQMPNYDDMSPQELADLVAFLKSLE